MSSTSVAAPSEAALVEAMRAGDERAFTMLVERHGSAMKRLARSFVASDAVAEEVVQETWLAVLKGVGRFEGRSSFKTWLFGILANQAKTRGVRESRIVPFASVRGDDEPSVDPDRFLGAGHDRWPGHWAADPGSWRAVPDELLVSRETLDFVAGAIRELPPVQQQVIALRDVEGWSSEEVCTALDISAGNQRVLLHRARSRVRAALDEYLAPT